MTEEINNRVTASTLETLDLETYYPQEGIQGFDLKPYLYRELILKEKEFREALRETDWEIYRGKWVAVHCSVDAVIPVWAYMLVASYLEPIAQDIVLGNEAAAAQEILLRRIRSLETLPFQDKRVVVKGCGDLPIGEAAYLEITKRLRPVAKSIMYGEPCSTVPVFKSR